MTGSGSTTSYSFSHISVDNSTFLADGIVRLYRNYDSTLEQGPLQMVSAFRALNEMVQLRQGSGLVMDWKQSAGTLLVGGDSHVVKVWDAQTETQGMVKFTVASLTYLTCFVLPSRISTRMPRVR
jgi:WD40 repeat protein